MRENIIDQRLVGKVIRIYVLGHEDPIEGVVDEVSKYEIGVSVSNTPYVVFRHAILYAFLGETDLHGYSQEDLDDTVLTSDLIGSEIEIHLTDGQKLEGRLVKLSKYEIGVLSRGKGLVVPKSNISFIMVLRK